MSTNQAQAQEVIIKGMTSAGRQFRPSDWAERLSGVMSSFGSDQKMRYSPFVRPTTLGGIKCVIISPKLQEVEPRAFNFLMSFAKENDLQVENA